MIIVMAIFLAYSYDRDQAIQNRRLARIPVRTRDQRVRNPLPEEEPNEVSPSIFYLGFLLVAYLVAMFIMSA